VSLGTLESLVPDELLVWTKSGYCYLIKLTWRRTALGCFPFFFPFTGGSAGGEAGGACRSMC